MKHEYRFISWNWQGSLFPNWNNTYIHKATTLINLYFFGSIKLMSENHIPNACSNQCLRTSSSAQLWWLAWSMLDWCLPEYRVCHIQATDSCLVFGEEYSLSHVCCSNMLDLPSWGHYKWMLVDMVLVVFDAPCWNPHALM